MKQNEVEEDDALLWKCRNKWSGKRQEL